MKHPILSHRWFLDRSSLNKNKVANLNALLDCLNYLKSLIALYFLNPDEQMLYFFRFSSLLHIVTEVLFK